jgi:hypothetical protein
MTRRGSLIYYLSAWAVGCFTITLSIWAKELIGREFQVGLTNYTFALIGFYSYALLFGAPLALLGGFLLRRIMQALNSYHPLHWTLLGAATAPALVLLFGWTGRYLFKVLPRDLWITKILTGIAGLFLFAGTEMVLQKGWWLAIPAGAATAYLLCRIERRFVPQPANA